MHLRYVVAACLSGAAMMQAQQTSWVARSNENAQALLSVIARFFPESAGSMGVEGLDEQIFDLKPKLPQRNRAAVTEALAKFEERLKEEKDSLVRQDLEILVDAARDNNRRSELNERMLIPYFDVGQAIFGGLRSLLDDQVDVKRRPAALVRLRKYAGLEKGYAPATTELQERIREALTNPKLLGPPKAELEREFRNTGFYLDGIGELFKKYGIAGYEEPLAKLKEQITAYHEFLKKELMPRARTDFRLPPELYRAALDNFGVDLAPEKLAAMAHEAFDAIQKEMQTTAALVAKNRSLPSSDYRDVIRALKREQLVGDAILSHYQKRLVQIEEIIRREKLVTLPERAARIRLASAAESAASPAPHMRPPRLLNNRGEMGEFVLPLNIPSASGATETYDDFTFDAASWTLTAHEARPGHEMQFAAMVERGVSAARAVFAFNSTNVEGWGLYSEAILQPFMPLEGRLISLQHRLMRAGRAYLDPELQMGKIKPADALRVLKEDVVLSEAMASQEVERYTVRSPGQATSYFYGYTRLMELRRDVEKKLGNKFDQQRFHDFVLAQGLLPPDLLRKTVLAEFVPGGSGD